MKIQTFSIVVGTRACDAKCPFCVSRMTGFDEIPRSRDLNEINFRKACRLAQLGGTTTVLMTGKGEPTLYPDEISRYLLHLEPHNFPFIELQTNGLALGKLFETGESGVPGLNVERLKVWRDLGLNTIAISTVGTGRQDNAFIYKGSDYYESYPDLHVTVKGLRDLGFTVRLCVMLQNGLPATGDVDLITRVRRCIDWCKDNDVPQLTIRPIRRPKRTEDGKAFSYVKENGMTDDQISRIHDWVEENGTKLMSLIHGAEIYDVGGQNVCLADCLTISPEDDDIRTLIFYPDGKLTYDWQYQGARLL